MNHNRPPQLAESVDSRRDGFGSVAFVALPGGGMVPADAAREVWESALCAEVDPELFFPEKGQPSAPAKAVCARCPVTALCLVTFGPCSLKEWSEGLPPGNGSSSADFTGRQPPDSQMVPEGPRTGYGRMNGWAVGEPSRPGGENLGADWARTAEEGRS